MITWLPASVSFVERLTCWSPTFWKHTTNALFGTINQIGTCVENFIITAVVSLPKLWILLLGTVGVLSGVVLFYWPKLQLPDSPDFKLFDSDHPFEIYDSQYRNMFWFEKLYTVTTSIILLLYHLYSIICLKNFFLFKYNLICVCLTFRTVKHLRCPFDLYGALGPLIMAIIWIHPHVVTFTWKITLIFPVWPLNCGY